MLLSGHPSVAQFSEPVAPSSEAQTAPDAQGVPPESTLRNWLLGDDPRLVAWAAHDVVAARNRNLIPDLLSVAAQWRPFSRPVSDAPTPTKLSPEQAEARDAMLAVLDALIQMDVPVPADTLRVLAPDFGNATAVLLSRMSLEDSGALSLEFYRLPTEHDYGLQDVSAALLGLRPVAGFAADLVSSIHVQAYIHVVLPGAPPSGMGFSSGSCIAPSESLPDNWPPIGQYSLTGEKGGGAVLLVAGIDPVFAIRKQAAQYLSDCSLTLGAGLSTAKSWRLVAEMLNTPQEAMEWQVSPETKIEFQSLQQFDSDLMAFVSVQQARYRATAEALAARDLLTPAEMEECLPELTLHLIDDRDQRADPLPKRTDLPPRVEWSQLPL
jgi:hypothetical protein